MREVSHDFEGLREYAYAQLASGSARPSGQGPGGPGIPAAYAAWLAFLFELEAAVRANPELRGRLRADTARGLAAVEQARMRFLAERKPCPRCGALTISSFICEHCGARLGGQARLGSSSKGQTR
jgi:hypothetical protein